MENDKTQGSETIAGSSRRLNHEAKTQDSAVKFRGTLIRGPRQHYRAKTGVGYREKVSLP
jgi:hypothetical protein